MFSIIILFQDSQLKENQRAMEMFFMKQAQYILVIHWLFPENAHQSKILQTP